MKRKLLDISTTRFGVNAKGMDKGPMALVQSSAINADGSIVVPYINRTEPSLITFKAEDLLRKDDVLFIGKGSINTAALWPGSAEDTVASSMLYVIRPNPDLILPAYLAAYLNSHPAKAQIARYIKAGTVPVVSRQALNDLEIPVPSLAEQRKLVQLADAVQRTKLHLNELSTSYAQLLDAVWATYPEP
ncbi:MAG: restriction endonuclease subunit S [Flavobacteriales bacterium]|nr:restriction endonuclease subunit S [Flavobacteriales bacterium]